jgi:D-alanyl-D-alanine-carboxypeptidase/D-alanyl-D-alanine-endopeptidase
MAMGGLLVWAMFGTPVLAQTKAPTDEQIKERLSKMVGDKKKTPGIIVGLIDKAGARVINAGSLIDGNTVFEIGSITKVFTAITLQDMVDHNELKLDDPIGKFLPATVKTPSRQGKQITLLDLATQSSGLPRLPDNISQLQLVSSNPYVNYGPKQLYDFLSSYELPRDIGDKYEYSNLGVGLLGHILCLKAGTNYEALIVNRICAPLNMDSTRITLSPDLKGRLALGHDASGKQVANWDFDALAGAGALRSTMNDMLKFLSANMGASQSALHGAMARSQEPRRDAMAGQKIGLAWHINTDGVVWHNGGTGGYRSFMGFNKKSGRGVVVLANSAGGDTDGLGLSILGPARSHAVAKVDPLVFDEYVGTYKLAPGAIFAIIRDGDHFFAQLTGQQRIEFFPESETGFFCKVVDAQLTFHKDASGKVTHLVLHQNGADQKAPKQ